MLESIDRNNFDDFGFVKIFFERVEGFKNNLEQKLKHGAAKKYSGVAKKYSGVAKNYWSVAKKYWGAGKKYWSAGKKYWSVGKKYWSVGKKYSPEYFFVSAAKKLEVPQNLW